MVKTYRTIQQWDHWLTEFLGRQVLEAEQKWLARLLAERYGKHALLIGVPRQQLLLDSTIIFNRVLISPFMHKNKPAHAIEGDFYQLPITPGSIDLVLLPHTLELIDNPHRLLLEACRIVKPEGDIIIMGFNSMSAWGLKKYLAKNKPMPWAANFIKFNRIINWLQLADFELVKQDRLLFRPPIVEQKTYQKLEFLEWIGAKLCIPWGGVYALVAKAKVIPLTPIKLHWKQKATVISATLPSGSIMRDIK